MKISDFNPLNWFRRVEKPAELAAPLPVANSSLFPNRPSPAFSRQTNLGSGLPSFEALRAFSKYDLVRLVIETKKDQISSFPWYFVAVDENSDKANFDLLTNFFHKPDGRLTFELWLGQILEDLLTIDAVTIYPRLNRAGGVHSLCVLDGATIAPIFDERGFLPLEGAAYYQHVGGNKICDFGLNDLIYFPKNSTSTNFYGFSPVEQIVRTLGLYNKRMVRHEVNFTEGNIPESYASCPPDWTTEQVKEWQTVFDEYSSQEDRNKVQFMPWGVDIRLLKPVHFDGIEFDESLTRLICFAFSVEPTALISQSNRSTSYTLRQQALKEGLKPYFRYLEGLMNTIIRDIFKIKDWEFQFDNVDSVDPYTKALSDVAYVQSGVKTPNEVRAELKLPPLSASQSATIISNDKKKSPQNFDFEEQDNK